MTDAKTTGAGKVGNDVEALIQQIIKDIADFGALMSSINGGDTADIGTEVAVLLGDVKDSIDDIKALFKDGEPVILDIVKDVESVGKIIEGWF